MEPTSIVSATPTMDPTERKRLERRVLFKLDVHVLPALAFLWLMNFIDRSNIGNARIAGLERDLGLKGNQFNIALSVFYITYIIVEIPSNMVLKRVGANIWLPALVCAWGLVTTLSGFVQNFAGLVAIRMVLGFCEGGLLGGMVLYLSTLYRRHEFQLRVALFYASASLSGAFGGLLATGLEKMNGLGNLAGWRWIFIIEGIATIVVGVVSALVMPENVLKARFLNEEERHFAYDRLRDDMHAAEGLVQGLTSAKEYENDKQDITHVEDFESTRQTPIVPQMDEKFEWRELRRGLSDVQVWLTGCAYMAICVSLYSFSLFLPTIVVGLGYSGTRAQLLTVPPYVPATVIVILIAFAADKLRWRGPFMLMFLPICIAGYALMLAADTNEQRYAGVFLIALGLYPSVPSLLSILPNNHAGHYKRATTTAFQLMLANLAGFIATFIYRPEDKPLYRPGKPARLHPSRHAITLGFVCLAWVLIAANVTYCWWENKARREGRREGNIAAYNELVRQGKTSAPIGDRNPRFMYTL